MKTSELQELLLATMPQWHYWINRPFKKLLDSGVSLGMYYCIQLLRMSGDKMTMTELATAAHCSKQQMTKTVARLIDSGLVRRTSDPNDRRVIRLELTQEGLDYIDRFLAQDAAYYGDLFDGMPPQDREDFQKALETLHGIFCRMDPECRPAESAQIKQEGKE